MYLYYFFIENRLFLSNHEYINVPINIVMVSKPGLYSSEHIIDFGVASRNGLVTSKALNLCNSAKSSIIVQVFNKVFKRIVHNIHIFIFF